MQCKLVTSIARKTFRYYREYCYRQFFFIAVNRWKRNSLPGTQLFLSSRKRERGRERKRTGETGGERPGEKFQTIACKTCAVISSVCRAPYVWFHSQLYNFIIREPRSRIVLGRFPIETLIERYRNLSFLCPSILNNSLIRFR